MINKIKEGQDMGVAKTPSRFYPYKNYYFKKTGGNVVDCNLKEKDFFELFQKKRSMR